MIIRACLHVGGRPQIGEITCRGSPELPCKRDQILWTGRLSHLSGVHQCKQAITRKITRKLSRTSMKKTLCDISNTLFIAIIIHKPSTVSSSLLCYKLMRAKTAGKTRNITDFLRIFLTRHAVTSRYYFAHFQNWKSSGLATGHLLSF